VTQEFEGAALTLINDQYGLSGVDAEQQTFLDDGNVSQVIQCKDSARRARAPFKLGYFNITLHNVHSIAGDLQSFADPYNPVNVHNGFPAVVDPTKFDIWILDAQANASVGGNITWGILGYDTEAELQGISDTAAGGGVTPADVRFYFGAFTDFTTISDSVGVEHGLTSGGDGKIKVRQRWAPDQPLLWRTQSTGGGSVTATIQAFIGPVGLGQDLF